MDHLTAHVTAWVADHPLRAIEVDCATAVMLKILDGKCKMPASEKSVMALLYHAVKQQPGLRLDGTIHQLIAAAGTDPDEAQRNIIYEQRVFAETMISRPVMKAFKAMIRARGLFAGVGSIDDEEAFTP